MHNFNYKSLVTFSKTGLQPTTKMTCDLKMYVFTSGLTAYTLKKFHFQTPDTVCSCQLPIASTMSNNSTQSWNAGDDTYQKVHGR